MKFVLVSSKIPYYTAAVAVYYMNTTNITISCGTHSIDMCKYIIIIIKTVGIYNDNEEGRPVFFHYKRLFC